MYWPNLNGCYEWWRIMIMWPYPLDWPLLATLNNWYACSQFLSNLTCTIYPAFEKDYAWRSGFCFWADLRKHVKYHTKLCITSDTPWFSDYPCMHNLCFFHVYHLVFVAFSSQINVLILYSTIPIVTGPTYTVSFLDSLLTHAEFYSFIWLNPCCIFWPSSDFYSSYLV